MNFLKKLEEKLSSDLKDNEDLVLDSDEDQALCQIIEDSQYEIHEKS